MKKEKKYTEKFGMLFSKQGKENLKWLSHQFAVSESDIIRNCVDAMYNDLYSAPLEDGYISEPHQTLPLIQYLEQINE